MLKRFVFGVVGAALLMAATFLFSPSVRADAIGQVIPAKSEALTPNSLCGVDAVGILPDGQWWKGRLADVGNTYDEKNNLRYGTAAVAADGKWFLCQPWIKPGEAPTTPQPDNTPCGGGLGVTPTWVGSTGITCKGDHPFAGAFAGKTEVFRSAELGKYGNATFKCMPGGKMEVQAGAECVQLPECAGSITVTWGGGCMATASGFFPAGTVIPLTSATKGWTGTAAAWCNPRTMALEQTGGTGCVRTK